VTDWERHSQHDSQSWILADFLPTLSSVTHESSIAMVVFVATSSF
jgi:hypothetical protein